VTIPTHTKTNVSIVSKEIIVKNKKYEKVFTGFRYLIFYSLNVELYYNA
jgi:hypothetical protein